MLTKRHILPLLFAVLIAASCCNRSRGEVDGTPEKVMILLSNGYNNRLAGYLSNDISEMKTSGYVPSRSSGDYLFILSKLGSSISTKGPVLTRIYRDSEERVVADTVYRKEKNTVLADAQVIKEFLEFVQTEYPARSYGMVVSSHATGWLPAGYYAHPETDPDHKKTTQSGNYFAWDARQPYRTITSEGTGAQTKEVDLADFVSAIPMHLDYLIIDACLCGVETAYAFKDVADYFACSPTEVMANGFDYSKIASHLLEKDVPDVKAVCEDFIYYYTYEYDYKCASVALYDCLKLPALASACKPLFEQYSEALCGTLDWTKTQGYFGGDKHWFFDLLHALEMAGASEEETAPVRNAIDQCLVYKGSTGKYYSDSDGKDHAIDHFSGISMYLPCAGTPYLDGIYRNTAWNQATGLVQ